MSKHDLGEKDIHKDAAALAPLLAGKIGGGTGSGDQPNWVPVMVGWNATTAARVDINSNVNTSNGIVMADAETTKGYGYFITPAGYTGTVSVAAVFRNSNVAGNFYVQMEIYGVDYFGDDGPSSTDPGLEAVSGASAGAASGHKSSASTVTITEQAIIRPKFTRWGGNASDTAATSLYLLGWEVTYS